MTLTRSMRLMLDIAGQTDQSDEMTLTADGADDRSIIVPGPTESPNDLEVALTLAKNQLKMLYLVADGAVTVKTNSKDAADDTFTLAANVPIVWYEGSGLANPFTADVTKLFMLTDETDDVTVDIRILVDATA